jgi:hypothetical protein
LNLNFGEMVFVPNQPYFKSAVRVVNLVKESNSY